MKSLEHILDGVEIIRVRGERETAVSRITADSRMVEGSALFVALKGVSTDGHAFIGKALELGARVIVAETTAPEELSEKVTWVQVPDSRKALARIASNFYDDPSSSLKLVGVTGTNGKTSVAFLLQQVFESLGYATGLISTVEIRWPGYMEPARMTTPDVITLNALLREMADGGCTHVFMEVSSHAVHQGRIDGLRFAGGIFTNITHDHLDYHGTFAHYISAKKGFFDVLPKGSFALVNADDRHGSVMLQNTAALRKSFALKHMADYKGRILENRLDGLLMRMNDQTVACRLCGEFNAYNLLAAYGAAMELGEAEDAVLAAISSCHPVQGRMDVIRDRQGRTGIVDFAHTPDALEKVIRTIRAFQKGSGRLVVVCGCGGDRDRAKRPVMGGIASRLADVAILTSDNPRSESPEAILNEMMGGVAEEHQPKVQSVTDRAQAIQVAARMLRTGDVLLVAGKGHENYQEIGGTRYPFDDKTVLKEALEKSVALA